MHSAQVDGSAAILGAFETAVASSHAVIAAPLAEAERIAMSDSAYFKTFAGMIEAGMQALGYDHFSSVRPPIEAKFFPSYEAEIRFGALSLNGEGLRRFGEIYFTLKDSAISTRTSLLETNMVYFAEKHGLLLTAEIPPGHRAPWEHRGRLAVAKHAHEISAKTDCASFHKVLLNSGPAPKDDVFIEAHIHGALNRHSVQSVLGPASFRRRTDNLRWKSIRSRFSRAGAMLTEVK